jgi:hypothetical protein
VDSTERLARIHAIDAECKKIQARLKRFHEERDQLVLAGNREEYPCSCVKLNCDIGIYDGSQQEKAGRKGLGIGLISQTFSCLKNCSVCRGTGKPVQMLGDKIINVGQL